MNSWHVESLHGSPQSGCAGGGGGAGGGGASVLQQPAHVSPHIPLTSAQRRPTFFQCAHGLPAHWFAQARGGGGAGGGYGLAQTLLNPAPWSRSWSECVHSSYPRRSSWEASTNVLSKVVPTIAAMSRRSAHASKPSLGWVVCTATTSTTLCPGESGAGDGGGPAGGDRGSGGCLGGGADGGPAGSATGGPGDGWVGGPGSPGGGAAGGSRGPGGGEGGSRGGDGGAGGLGGAGGGGSSGGGGVGGGGDGGGEGGGGSGGGDGGGETGGGGEGAASMTSLSVGSPMTRIASRPTAALNRPSSMATASCARAASASSGVGSLTNTTACVNGTWSSSLRPSTACPAPQQPSHSHPKVSNTWCPHCSDL